MTDLASARLSAQALESSTELLLRELSALPPSQVSRFALDLALTALNAARLLAGELSQRNTTESKK